MFTLPPSPLPSSSSAPPPLRQLSPNEDLLDETNNTPTNLQASYTTTSHLRRLARWTIVLPLILVLTAAGTRFLTHPAILDLLIPNAEGQWTSWKAQMLDWTLHEQHDPGKQLVVRGTPTLVPIVPTNPVLPTPFPQPFDTTLSTNFSTNSCYNFFINMTQSEPFRSCRPFSLLLTKSQAFQQAQNNIDAMNTDIWGTCNTDITQDQCDANMAWFASSLQSSCPTDLAAQNAMAMDTLTALQAYDLMRNAACQVDPATNAYCYVEAVADSDPSSYWFYLLPLGRPLVPITNGACTVCTQTLMATYADALSGDNNTLLDALAQTYSDAVTTLNNACGSSYAKAVTVTSSSGAERNGIPGLLGLFVVLLLGELLMLS